MPIFEFICEDCQTKFESFLRSSDDTEEVICKKCGGQSIFRIFSTFGIGGSDGGKTCGSCSAGSCEGCN